MAKAHVVHVLLSQSIKNNGSETRTSKFDHSSQALHNVTVDCPDVQRLGIIASRCQNDLSELAMNGFPWILRRDVIDLKSSKDVPYTLGDGLDSLDHVCNTLDRTRLCLHDNDIRDYCLLTTMLSGGITPQTHFYFMCHLRRRDENLVRSLRCLHDKRVLSMLPFHIGKQCGLSALDRMMGSRKNADFYLYDTVPLREEPHLPSLFCLPSDVISPCVEAIVEQRCGADSADLVKEYLLYHQDRVRRSLASAGLPTNICELGTSDYDYAPKNVSFDIMAQYGKTGFDRLLEMAAPGSALDTAFGRYVMAFINAVREDELCFEYPYMAYSACKLASDSKIEPGKFNILQYAHQLMPFVYHGARCSMLHKFTACWTLLRQICGPRVRGFALHATLWVGGCEIQSQMNEVGCPWQDMLLEEYVRAGSLTVWPLTSQAFHNAMFLERQTYVASIQRELEDVISLLQPAVDEIAAKCGREPASRLSSFFRMLRYVQLDGLKYALNLEKNLHVPD